MVSPEELQKRPSFVSVTDLCSYLYCPRALYQQKVLGYEEKLNKAMILGGIRHNFYDNINKSEENIVVGFPSGIKQDEIIEAYSGVYLGILKETIAKHNNSLALFDITPDDIFRELKPIAATEANERAENVFNFASRNNMFGEDLWQNLTPKILTEVKIRSPRLKLKGNVDRVEIHKGMILPIELKTGKMAKEGVWPSHRVQVAAYMMLLQEEYKQVVVRAIIRYLDYQQSRTVMLNPYMEMEVKETTEKVLRLLASSEPPGLCGRENCACTR